MGQIFFFEEKPWCQQYLQSLRWQTAVGVMTIMGCVLFSYVLLGSRGSVSAWLLLKFGVYCAWKYQNMQKVSSVKNVFCQHCVCALRNLPSSVYTDSVAGAQMFLAVWKKSFRMVTPQLWCFLYLFIVTELCWIFLFLPPTPTSTQILCWLEATSFIFECSLAQLPSLKLICSKLVCRMWKFMATYAYLWKFLTLASINHSKHFIISKND